MATEFYNRNWRMPKSSNSSKVSNYSMSFDGNSEFIDCGTDIGNYFGENYTGEMAISIWFKADVTSSDDGIFIFTGSFPLGEISAAIYANDLEVRVRGNTEVSGSFTDTSNWHNLIINLFGPSGANQVYLDGVAFGSTFTYTSGGLDFNGETFEIGHYGGTRYFSGKLDHCSIFDYALSAQQISDLQGSSSTGVGNPMSLSAKPKFYYPIGDYAAFNGSEYLVNNGALSDYVFNFTTTSSPHNKITVNNLSVLNQSSKLSFSGWINLQDVSRLQNILNIFDTSGVSRIAINTYNNSIRFNVNRAVSGNSYNELSISSLVGDGDWFHFAAVFDGTFTASPVQSQNQGRLKFYINGQNYVPNYLSGSVPSSIGDLGSSSFLEIGYNNPVNVPSFLGMANNIAFWNTNLSPSEIETLYNNGTPYVGTQPQSSNLQGWWKLDASATFDGSNWSIPDDSSNSNTGTSSGMTAANLVQSNLNITQPYSRYALDFDGTNDYIDCGNSTNLRITPNLTVSVWFKTSTSQIGKFINRDGFVSGTRDYALYQNASNIQFWVSHNGTGVGMTVLTSTGFTANDNNWHHAVGVCNGTNIELYIDGVLNVPGTNSTAGINTSTYINEIGSRTTGTGNLFNGSLSNVSIWNAALTAAQITELYNQGKPSNLNNHSAYSNLVSWWQLGENSSFDGTNWTVLDEKGTNNGTSANMTEADLVNGVGTTGNGLSDGMGGADNIIGDAPYSTANAVSYGMGVDARVSGSGNVPS